MEESSDFIRSIRKEREWQQPFPLVISQYLRRFISRNSASAVLQMPCRVLPRREPSHKDFRFAQILGGNEKPVNKRLQLRFK